MYYFEINSVYILQTPTNMQKNEAYLNMLINTIIQKNPYNSQEINDDCALTMYSVNKQKCMAG